MPDKELDAVKLVHGKSFDEWFSEQEVSPDESLKVVLGSKYKPVEIGTTAEGEAVASLEQLTSEHIHVLGGTGSGKSKFFQWLSQIHIDRGNGLTFIDQSQQGNTVKGILRYCARKGHLDRVIWIDVEGDCNPVLNPLLGDRDVAVSAITAAIKDSYNIKDASLTANISRYYPAVMNVLYNAGATLADSRFFALLDWEYEYARKKILECSDPKDEYRRVIEQAILNREYRQNFLSTTTRLSNFSGDILKAFYGTHEGIDLSWLIKNDYIILVNFFRDKLDQLPHRLLGTIFINQILRAIKDLNRQGWVKPYFLMMDEAARLGTEELGELLAYWRQAGLRVILGHQFFDQFQDFPKLLSSINANCAHEVMFDVKHPADRLKMVSRFYGGKIPDREAEFYMRDIKKQHAIIKLGRLAPQLVRIPDVPDDNLDVIPIIKELQKQKIYRSNASILEEVNARYGYERPANRRQNKTSAKPRTAPDRAPNNEDNSKPRGRTIWDNLPESNENS